MTLIVFGIRPPSRWWCGAAACRQPMNRYPWIILVARGILGEVAAR
jgi:hypothetical protein